VFSIAYNFSNSVFFSAGVSMSVKIKRHFFLVFHHFSHSQSVVRVNAHYYPVRLVKRLPSYTRRHGSSLSVFQYVATAAEAAALMKSMCSYMVNLEYLSLPSHPDFNGGQLSLF